MTRCAAFFLRKGRLLKIAATCEYGWALTGREAISMGPSLGVSYAYLIPCA